MSRGAPGYRQGLFVITVHGAHGAHGAHGDGSGSEAPGKRRLVVQLVALDVTGMLRALDPPTSLIEATARMIEADEKDGNGPWRKLSARITPKPDGGATLHVDVI